MKHKFLIGCLLSLGVVVAANAQSGSIIIGAFPSVPAAMSASSTSNVLDVVSVKGAKGVAIMPIFVGSNSVTANVIFSFSFSPDGTNYSTTTTTKTNAINGTTTVKGLHLFSAAELAGMELLRLNSIQNAGTGKITNTAIVYSIQQ